MEKSPGGSSPEFEFWMVGNNPPSFPQPHDLLTADQLFADGIILPLHSLLDDPNPNPDSSPPREDPSLPLPPPPPPPSFPSKKWKHIFRPKDKLKSSSSSSVGSSAELNIHIWPFSRSRSAGNGASRSVARPRVSASSGRKFCSAPCSRSNSRGEEASSSKPAAAKKWGPLAGGIHVGRSMPVWQLRRGGSGKRSGGGGGGGGMLNLNVNTCIGYGGQVSSCRGEDKDEVTRGEGNGGGGGGGDGDSGGGSGSLFNLRAMFSKKVY